MAGRRPQAKACSDACRVAAHKRAVAADKAKAEERAAAREVRKAVKAVDAASTEPAGRLEDSVRAKFEALGINGFDEDPLAVHLLGMARALDRPGTIAPSSFTSMGKAFRESYKEYVREHGGTSGPTTDTAEDEAARQLAALTGGGA